MRIGEVNKDNYKFFLQMLGAKSNKALDALMGNGDDEKTKGLSEEEELYQKMVKLGYIEQGEIIIKDGEDMSKYNRIVPVSDEVREKIITTVRNQFLRNGNGMTKPGVDSSELGAIMKEYSKSFPPSERIAISWTLSQIQINEAQRLVDYVKKNDPTWTHGQKFDKNILLNSNFGTNTVDVKA